jgi:hypothetical protein
MHQRNEGGSVTVRRADALRKGVAQGDVEPRARQAAFFWRAGGLTGRENEEKGCEKRKRPIGGAV